MGPGLMPTDAARMEIVAYITANWFKQVLFLACVGENKLAIDTKETSAAESCDIAERR